MDKEFEGCASGCAGCSGCGHDHEDFEMLGESSPVITLTDDEGKDVQFEVLDVVVMDDEKEYLILSEVKDEKNEEDVEVSILEIKEEDGEEVYDTVTDQKVSDAVFERFLKQQDELEETLDDDSDDEE